MNEQPSASAPIEHAAPTRTERTGETMAVRLRRLALERATFFTTSRQELYASVQRGGHTEALPLQSRAFKHWLLHCYTQQTQGQLPNPTTMQTALESLAAYAQEQGTSGQQTCVRLAHQPGRIYLDLANERRQVVEIDRQGWRVLEQAPVLFRRPAGLLPLPCPVPGGTLQELGPFFPMQTAADRLLVTAWLLAFFLPEGALSVLHLQGEQGSAKLTASRLRRRLLDPHEALLRSAPQDARALAILAHNNAIVAFDNLSYVPAWLSNALCTLSTGAGDAFRTLYTNEEETIFAHQRPVLLNSIEEVLSRGDLLDRTISIRLPPLPCTPAAARADLLACGGRHPYPAAPRPA